MTKRENLNDEFRSEMELLQTNRSFINGIKILYIKLSEGVEGWRNTTNPS